MARERVRESREAAREEARKAREEAKKAGKEVPLSPKAPRAAKAVKPSQPSRHICSVCHKDFRWASHLKRHFCMKACDNCGKVFTHQRSYKIHQPKCGKLPVGPHDLVIEMAPSPLPESDDSTADEPPEASQE